MNRHDRSHGYHVLGNLTLPIFQERWGADEEILLVESIRLFGLGNWADVADHVGTKSAEDCESHYVAVFLAVPIGEGGEMAEGLAGGTLCVGKGKTPARSAPVAHSTESPSAGVAAGFPSGAGASCGCRRACTPKCVQEQGRDGRNVGQCVLSSTGPFRVEPPIQLGCEGHSGSTYRRFDKVAYGVLIRAHDAPHEPGDLPALAGFLPLRGDFDVEHDNDAELILADMEFSKHEQRAERRLKLQIVHIYNYKLKVRRERKAFAIERGLLDFRFRQAVERRRPKDEREIYNKMRVFARFQTAAEHENFVRGLLREQRIRKRIRQLQNYRSRGICTLLESEEFERERKRHCSTGNAFVERVVHAPCRGSDAACATATSTGRPCTGDEIVGGVIGGHRAANAGATGAEVRDGGILRKLKPGCFAAKHELPGKLLNDGERKICCALKLSAKQYIIVKDALIRESVHLGFLSRKLLSMLVKIDVNKTGKLYDFFARCGWVELL